MLYNWQQGDWPEFRYDLSSLRVDLLLFAEQFGRLSGLLEGLPDGQGQETMLGLMVAEAMNSSAIEGETLDRGEVMSSIRNRLGLNPSPEPVKSRLAKGAGELMVAVRSGFSEPLDEKTLFEWHTLLLGDSSPLRVGDWRRGNEPTRVVSGRIDRPVVHFEAPPSKDVPREMAGFIRWFNDTAPGGKNPIHDAPVRSAIAHLYFESIHPFEDGNGRIGRALSEKALSQGVGAPLPLSLSKAIEAERSDYHDALKAAQRGNEVTAWIRFFTGVVLAAQQDAGQQIAFSLGKTKFFRRCHGLLNERQLKVIRKVLDAGPGGFEGGMNVRKYIAITKTSKATATRDLHHLAASGIVAATGTGRATRYEIVFPDGW
jgi:Fic family protein